VDQSLFVAYVPISLADQYRSAAGLAFVPITDLSPARSSLLGPPPAALAPSSAVPPSK
jgi:hypothetical protein